MHRFLGFPVRLPFRKQRPCLKLVVAFSFVLSLCNHACYSDLYSETVLSLEWLVDSSDIVCHVSVHGHDGKSRQVSKVQAFKSVLSDKELQSATVSWSRAIPGETNEEWLLFFRRDSNDSIQLFRSINLTRPLESPWSGAVSKRGVPLPDRHTILRAVTARINERRKLPPDCDRELVDTHSAVETQFRRKSNSRNQSRIQKSIGGFPHPHLICGYWDENGPYDHDTILSVVVPADVECKKWFLRNLSENKQLAEHSLDNRVTYDRIIYALANYPGQDTEQALQQFRGGNDERANEVLHFLREQKP